jgi:hypothetical protein
LEQATPSDPSDIKKLSMEISYGQWRISEAEVSRESMYAPTRIVVLASLLALFPRSKVFAQSAPNSIANSLIEFTWLTDSANGSELVLFRADGTFQDIQNLSSGYPFTETVSSPPGSGKYTYSVAPENPGVGIITVTSGKGGSGLGSGGTQLTFYAPTRGTGGVVPGDFYLSPNVAPGGAGNVSTRGLVSAANPMTAGFVIEGSQSRWVLVRGDGPSLAPFGVSDAIQNPQATIFSGAQARGTLSVWSQDANLVPGYESIFALAGAFPLATGSADCVALLQLAPGAYTVQGSGGGAEGEILLEVYILPFGS